MAEFPAKLEAAVAVKVIEGASKADSFSELQHVLSEQVKKRQANGS